MAPSREPDPTARDLPFPVPILRSSFLAGACLRMLAGRRSIARGEPSPASALFGESSTRPVRTWFGTAAVYGMAVVAYSHTERLAL